MGRLWGWAQAQLMIRFEWQTSYPLRRRLPRRRRKLPHRRLLPRCRRLPRRRLLPRLGTVKWL